MTYIRAPVTDYSYLLLLQYSSQFHQDHCFLTNAATVFVLLVLLQQLLLLMLLLVQTEVFRVDSIINSINPSITATRVTTSSPSSTTRGGALSCEGEHLNMLTD